jgi:hypothetical protein
MTCLAQGQGATIDNVGRGRPFAGSESPEPVGATVPFWNRDVASANGGAAPAGVGPLERDLFTPHDFYVHTALGSAARYFRSNSPTGFDPMWGDYATGPRTMTG